MKIVFWVHSAQMAHPSWYSGVLVVSLQIVHFISSLYMYIYAHRKKTLWKGDIIMIKWTQKWIMEKAGQVYRMYLCIVSSFSVTSYYPGNWFFFSCPLYAFQDQSEGTGGGWKRRNSYLENYFYQHWGFPKKYLRQNCKSVLKHFSFSKFSHFVTSYWRCTRLALYGS